MLRLVASGDDLEVVLIDIAAAAVDLFDATSARFTSTRTVSKTSPGEMAIDGIYTRRRDRMIDLLRDAPSTTSKAISTRHCSGCRRS